MFKRLMFKSFISFTKTSGKFKNILSHFGQVVLFIGTLAALFGIDFRRSATYQMFTLLAGMLLIAALWAATQYRRFPALSVERELPIYATVGEPLRYQLTLTNHTSVPQSDLRLLEILESEAPTLEEFLAADSLEDRSRNWLDRQVGYYSWSRLVKRKRGASSEEQAVPAIAPQQSVTLELSIMPERRGKLRFGGSRIYNSDPFGILRITRMLAFPQSCCVLPKRYPVAPLIAGEGRVYQRGGINLANSVGDSEEFLALRDYRPGDSLRSVHWRKSAKLDNWVVKSITMNILCGGRWY